MSEHGKANIHKAERLSCGCRADPITGAAFIVCSQHAVPSVLNKIVSCNTEVYKIGVCGKPARWTHPRYPTGVFCDDHHNTLSQFLRNDWSCSSGKTMTDIPDIVVLRAPTSALKPLCPFCASQHIVAPQQIVESPASIILDCKDCGCRFKSSEINGYAMSVDSKPATCPRCNTVVYGACTCNPAGP